MTIEFDDKGKYFTDIISKVAIPAIIQTTTHRIAGSIHVRPGGRIKDELDRVEAFLAVTGAIVYDGGGNEVLRADFLSVQRSQIVWIAPRDEPEHPGGER